MKITTVEQIIKKYLDEHEYDGLYTDDCGCSKDNLFPCRECCVENCSPGYKKVYEDGSWSIVPEKPEKLSTPFQVVSRGIMGFSSWECSECGRHFVEVKIYYCPYCGTKLDWSNLDSDAKHLQCKHEFPKNVFGGKCLKCGKTPSSIAKGEN